MKMGDINFPLFYFLCVCTAECLFSVSFIKFSCPEAAAGEGYLLLTRESFCSFKILERSREQANSSERQHYFIFNGRACHGSHSACRHTSSLQICRCAVRFKSTTISISTILGLGGLLTGNAAHGGLQASAGTPFGTQSRSLDRKKQ
jgi:hypothetical protein